MSSRTVPSANSMDLWLVKRDSPWRLAVVEVGHDELQGFRERVGYRWEGGESPGWVEVGLPPEGNQSTVLSPTYLLSRGK